MVVVGACLALGYFWARDNPEDLPWTPLDLSEPVGMFTGRKLAALTGDAPRCRRLLEDAGIGYAPLPAREEGPHCGYDDGVRPVAGDDAQRLSYAPTALTISCPVDAALALWEWHVVQPAAIEAFGAPVRNVEQLGGYNCRRMYGDADAAWSEHATADAIDIAAFVLADDRRVSVAGGWSGDADERRFLRAVRDGACDLFATVLSPDYNAAHADHLHLDQAERGRSGRSVCR